mgnify:FL=1
MTNKELDKLYKEAVGYHIGKGGVEKSIILAMDCYEEFLDGATPKHPNYLDAHHGMAQLCKQMGDMSRDNDMAEEAKDWYDRAIKHYETVVVKHKDMAFDDRLLAEVEYDKLRKELANGGKKKSLFKRLFGK